MKLIEMEMAGKFIECPMVNENLITGVCKDDADCIIIETENTLVYLGTIDLEREKEFMVKLRDFLNKKDVNSEILLIKKDEFNHIEEFRII